MQCSGTSILSYRQHESNCILWSCLTILSLLKNQVWVRQDRCDVHIIWLADMGRLVFNFTFCGIFSSYWAICYQVSGEWLLWLYFWNTHHVFSFVWERERERQAQVLGIIIQCPGELLAHISLTEPYWDLKTFLNWLSVDILCFRFKVFQAHTKSLCTAISPCWRCSSVLIAVLWWYCKHLIWAFSIS